MHSTTTSPASWLTQVQRRPPSLALLLAVCSQPVLHSLPLAAAPSDPHLDQPPPSSQMTQVVQDLVGLSEAAVWELSASPSCRLGALSLLLAALETPYSLRVPCHLGDNFKKRLICSSYDHDYWRNSADKNN